MAKANDRIISFDILRIIAAFAVVMLHFSGQRFIDSFPTGEWEIRNVYDSIVRWCVPIFVMVSGALFLNQDKGVNIRNLYKKNIFRIVRIFLFWSFLYALHEAYIHNSLSFMSIVVHTINGPFHFWFLKMLLGIYIIIPILRVVVQNKRLEEYVIILAIFLSFIIPMLIDAVAFWSEVSKEQAIKYYNGFGIRITSGFVGYFLLGHYLFYYRLSNAFKKIIYCMGLLSVLSVMYLTHWFSHHIGSPIVFFYGNLNVFTLFESATVFLIINEMKVSAKWNPLIIKLSNLSFGVYLIHVIIYRSICDFWGINSISLNPIFFIPCYSMIIFMLSCLIISIIKKVPILKMFV